MNRFWRTKQGPLLVFAVVAGAIVLYAPSLSLPILYDDLLHIRIAKGLDWWTVWLPTADFGFYRPLTFFPLLVIKQLFGRYPSALLHGLNVVQHALNAGLLMLLCWRVWREWRPALIAGLLFTLFPFSYQAIAVYGHNVHPTTTGLILLALHSYLSAWRHGKIRWWLLTGLLFVLGLLSHETAILFGPLAALVQWTVQRPQVRTFHWRKWPAWLVFTLLGVVYVVVYQFLPVTAEQQVGGPSPLIPKLLYVLQAVEHPLLWFGQFLPEVDATIKVLLGLLPILGLTAWNARRPENRWSLLLAWGWWAGASAVIAFSLETDYLLHGPRLLYLGSVGVALLWALWLEQIFQQGAWGRWLGAAVLIFVLVTGWRFVRGRLEAYEILTSPVSLMKEVMAERLIDEGVLLVNLPEWIAPSQTTYPVGSEHVAMLGYHLFAEELVAENLGDRPVRVMKVTDALGDPGFPYQVFAGSELSGEALRVWSRNSSQVFLTRYADGGLTPFHAGGLRPAGREDERAYIAGFGNYRLEQALAINCNSEVLVETSWHWTDAQPPLPTTSLFVQVLDASGQLAAQADGPPLGLRADLIAPVQDWVITDLRSLKPAGEPTEILVGVYDYASGTRFPAQNVAGEALPDDALRLPVTLCENAQ